MIDQEQVKRIQRRLDVTPDGIFGRGTWSALFVRLGCGPERARELAVGANVHVPAAKIDTGFRLAHFMTQLGHESDGFRAMEEYASGAAYEGRMDLGNTEPGDGVRFKGRGPIQITGRTNYRVFGYAAGIDLERHPEIAAIPSIGMLVACLYWTARDLNPLADADDIEAITRRINGGLRGLDDRKRRLVVAKGLLT